MRFRSRISFGSSSRFKTNNCKKKSCPWKRKAVLGQKKAVLEKRKAVLGKKKAVLWKKKSFQMKKKIWFSSILEQTKISFFFQRTAFLFQRTAFFLPRTAFRFSRTAFFLPRTAFRFLRTAFFLVNAVLEIRDFSSVFLWKSGNRCDLRIESSVTLRLDLEYPNSPVHRRSQVSSCGSASSRELYISNLKKVTWVVILSLLVSFGFVFF